jgi:hypothetical protein
MLSSKKVTYFAFHVVFIFGVAALMINSLGPRPLNRQWEPPAMRIIFVPIVGSPCNTRIHMVLKKGLHEEAVPSEASCQYPLRCRIKLREGTKRRISPTVNNFVYVSRLDIDRADERGDWIIID